MGRQFIAALFLLATLPLTAQALDIGASKTNPLNVAADDTRDSLTELASKLARECTSEVVLKSFSNDLHAHYSNPQTQVESREVSQIVSSDVETTTERTSTDVVFGENDIWFEHPSSANAAKQVSASLRVTMLESESAEQAAKVEADLSSDDLDLSEMFEMHAQIPVVVVHTATARSCIENNWGRRLCSDKPAMAPTAELVMGSGFIPQMNWINASTVLTTKKVLDLADYASCVYFKWSEARP